MTSESEKSEKIKKEKANLYITSAVSVFEEKGYHNTRVKDITDKAGTSVGNFYRYFETKEQVFELIIDQFYNLMVEELKKLQQFKDKPPPIRIIKEVFQAYISIFKEKRKIALIYIEQMGGINKALKKKKNEYQEKFAQEVEVIISNLVELGVVREQNIQITSRVWVSALLEIFRWWIRSDFELAEDKLINNITNFLVKGTMSK